MVKNYFVTSNWRKWLITDQYYNFMGTSTKDFELLLNLIAMMKVMSKICNLTTKEIGNNLSGSTCNVLNHRIEMKKLTIPISYFRVQVYKKIFIKKHIFVCWLKIYILNVQNGRHFSTIAFPDFFQTANSAPQNSL